MEPLADPMIQRTALEFLRPAWLWALPVLLLGWLLWWRAGARALNAWDAAVDPVLRPYVIEPASARGRRLAGPLALLLGWCVALLVLAGPVFEQREVPLHEARGAEVVLFDLSRSMRADDLPPDRLSRARFKLDDLFERAGDSRFALIAFSERPYVISPLTDDVATLRAFLPSLSPEIMPVQGSRLDLAIARGVTLLENAGVRDGRLLAITDAEPDAAAVAAARDAARLGHRVSVLAVGTARGAPLRGADGQFVTEPSGAIAVPRMDLAALDALARAGNGIAVALSSDRSDLERLAADAAPARRLAPDEDGESRAGATERWWIERGPWLLWPLGIAALALFRRETSA